MMHALAAQRRQAILEIVDQREYATILEIQAATGSSASTVHRDLAHLAESGEVRRIRGGVTRARAAGSRDDLDDLRRQLTEAARRLHPGQLPAARLLLQALTACERHERRTSSASLRRSTGT